MSGTLAISARGLTKTYGPRTRALDGVDLDVEEGAMVALTGPSGSGKSTLLYALAGLVTLDAGRVMITGTRPADSAAWTRLRAGTIGLVFQESLLLPALNVAQNIELPMIGVEGNGKARAARVGDLLAAVGLEGFERRLPDSLSGGERQRAAIARSLANRPRLLLADEPTGELDSGNTAKVMELIHKLHETEGLTVLIVTHDSAIAATCSRRFTLADGRGRYEV